MSCVNAYSRVFLVLIVSTWTGFANAGLITHKFAGTITEINFTSGDFFSGAIEVGTLFDGSYTFDPSIAPNVGDACEPLLSQCTWDFDSSYLFEATVGGISFTDPDGFKIRITDNADEYVVSTAGLLDFGGVMSNIQLPLLDLTETAITDPRVLFLDAPDLNDFNSNRDRNFRILFGSGATLGDISGRIESYYRVPIPTTATLFGIGLAGLGWSRRRRLAVSK
jgi:hypothetical protein